MLGIDFDNTIVSYDALFHRVAVERGLIPPELEPSKERVRNYLRAAGREDDWTEMQGCVYGARIAEAVPFPGVLEFFAQCVRRGVPVCVISHKTERPFRGPGYELHAAARSWLEQQGFFDVARIGLPAARVFFETTKQAKLARIAHERCTHFVDDLPELLAEPSFPANVEPLLFDPQAEHRGQTAFRRAESWAEIQAALLSPFGTTPATSPSTIPSPLAGEGRAGASGAGSVPCSAICEVTR
jgi:hypothetical protein